MNPGRVAGLVLGALVLQVCLLAQFSFHGARPEVMILVVLAVGYLSGPDHGAVVGFAAGLALDVVLSTPFGLTAFVYTIMGYGIGSVTSGVVRSAPWISAPILGAGSAVAMVLYALIGAVIGLDTLGGPPLLTIVLVVAVVNTVLAPLALWLVGWARSVDRPRRRRSVFA